MKDCTRFRPMIGSRPGELTADEARGLEEHLAGCEVCRAFAADLEATSGLVSEALMARAAQRDFAPFVDQVMAQVGQSEGTPAPVPGRAARSVRPERGPAQPAGVEGRGFLAWLSTHRRAALAALVPAVAALALIVYVRQAGEGGAVALLEVSAEGEATTVIQTADGPIVLLAPEEHT